MIADMDIMSRGIACLIRELGIVEAETFISYIKNENFDYTKWRQDKFDDLTHPNETKTEKFFRKTGEFLERTKNDIKNSCGC